MKERFRLQYTQTNDNDDTDLDIDITFEAGSTFAVLNNINTWLVATGYPFEIGIRRADKVDLTGEED
jgi:hypothetical protein